MKRKYDLSIQVEVASDNETDFETVNKNLNLLSDMAQDLGLVVDGTTAELVFISHQIKEKKKRGRPAKTR